MNNDNNLTINQIFLQYKKIAVVGLSNKPHRDSYVVARFMKENGFQIFPVNPGYAQILGENCYPTLSDIPEPVDLVNIFRKSEHVLPIVEEAIRLKAKAIWMQLGVINVEAAELAMAAGLEVIMDHCWKIEYLNRNE